MRHGAGSSTGCQPSRAKQSSATPTSARRPGIEEKFLAVPNAKLAGEALEDADRRAAHRLQPEDHKTAEYVAQKFRAAGLETEIVPYRVLMNQPKVVKVEAFDAAGKQLMSGPTREHVEGDPFDNNPARRDALQRIVGFRRRDRRSGLRQLRPPRRLRRTREAAHRPARQDRDRPLRREFSRREGLHRRAARRHRRPHLLRSAGRRLLQGRSLSDGPVAAGERRAARIGAISLQVSRRSGNTGRCVHARSARLGARQSRGQPAAHHLHPAQLSRCRADSARR